MKKKVISRERIFLIIVSCVIMVSFVILLMNISGFFSDNLLNIADIKTGNLSVDVNNLKVYHKTSDADDKAVAPDPDDNHETGVIVRPDKIGKFSFFVENTGLAGISADIYLNINFGANFDEKGVILIYPTSLSDADITANLENNDYTGAIINQTADDQISIDSSTGTFNGIRQKIDTVKLDSSDPKGTTGIATNSGETKHYYEYKIVFLDKATLSPEYYYNSLELKVEANAVYHDSSVPNWKDDDSDYFRCHIADPIRYIEDGLILYYDGINNTGLGHKSDTSIWKDLIGSNDGQLMNNPTWEVNALGFDGINDKVKFEGRITQNYTIVATFKNDPDFHTMSHQRIYSESPFPSLYINGQNKYPRNLRMIVGGIDHAPFQNSDFSGITQTVVTFDGSSLKLYINGVLADDIATTVAPPASVVQNCFLGGRLNNDRQLKGSIYDFLIYDRVLNQAEVTETYDVKNTKLYIPIKTEQDFQSIGSGNLVKVDGIMYCFDSTAMYEVKNDLSFTNPNPGMWMPNITGEGSITSYDKVVTITNTDSSVHYYQNQLYVTKDNAIKSNLLLHYDTKNNSGTGHNLAATMWKDLQGANDATLTSGANWTGGLGGLFFDGTSGRATFNATVGDLTGGYSMVMTIKPELTGTYPRLFGENPFPTLYLRSNTDYRFTFYSAGTDTSFSPGVIPSTTKPTYVVMTYVGTTLTIFVDGKKAGTLTTPDPPDTSAGLAYLGARATDDRFYKGLIYDYMIYDRVLSDFEIERSYITNYSKYY